MNTEQFDYKVEEEIKKEESNTGRQKESKKIEKRTRERLSKVQYIKKTIDIEKKTADKLVELAEFYKLNQRLTLDFIINAMYKEKIKEEKEKYKETLEEQVRRLLNERNEIMANQAELLNRFIDLQKEVDDKIENKFSIESNKVDRRIEEYKETMDSHYKKIAGTINNLQIDTLKSVVKENGRRLEQALIDIAGLEQNKINKPFK